MKWVVTIQSKTTTEKKQKIKNTKKIQAIPRKKQQH